MIRATKTRSREIHMDKLVVKGLSVQSLGSLLFLLLIKLGLIISSCLLVLLVLRNKIIHVGLGLQEREIKREINNNRREVVRL